MRIAAALGACALFLAPCAVAQEAPPVRCEPAEVDFGIVTPGSSHEARFVLRNAGTQPVRIAKATPSCKCTEISPVEGLVIAPGSELELRATLAVPRTPGEKDAKVFLVFEGFKAPLLAKMRADASLPVRATPAFVDALKGVSSGSVRVESRDGKPFRILSAGGTAPIVTGPQPGDPQAAYDIGWTLPRPDASGQIPLWWLVETDRDDAPIVALRIRHETTGVKADPGKDARFWFFPDPIVVAGRLAPSTPIELSTEIHHNNPKGRGRIERPDWQSVQSVRSLSPLATATLIEARAGGPEESEVRFRFELAPGASGMLVIPVEVRTATGTGVVPVAASVPRAGGAP